MMGRHGTNPVLLDRVLQINISKLKKHGWMKPGQIVTKKLCWTQDGNYVAAINITVNMARKNPLTPEEDNPFVLLEYMYRGELRKYTIDLEWLPSNLGKGKIWYFRCPHTSKRCRILYEVQGFFVHREAFSDCIYYIQTQSQTQRSFSNFHKIDLLFKELDSKHFKKTYNGYLTKRHLGIIRQVKYLTDHLPNSIFDETTDLPIH